MLQSHGYVLRDGDLALRSLTEREGKGPGAAGGCRGTGNGGIAGRAAAAPAHSFVLEVGGVAAGHGWVRPVEASSIPGAQPGRTCRRVGVWLAPSWRGRGIGTRAIRLLTAHAFARGADVAFALGVAASDAASLRALRANRYVPWRRVGDPGRCDLVCRRNYFEGRAAAAPHPGPDGVRAADAPHGAMVVVYRRAPAPEVLLLHRAGLGEGEDWAWTPPSGARFPAEPPDECAARELYEETGLDAMPARVAGAGTARWWVYRLEVAADVEVAADAAIAGTKEHDRHAWVPADAAVLRCRPEVLRASLAAALASLDM